MLSPYHGSVKKCESIQKAGAFEERTEEELP